VSEAFFYAKPTAWKGSETLAEEDNSHHRTKHWDEVQERRGAVRADQLDPAVEAQPCNRITGYSGTRSLTSAALHDRS
jgi:hypothetical protein